MLTDNLILELYVEFSASFHQVSMESDISACYGFNSVGYLLVYITEISRTRSTVEMIQKKGCSGFHKPDTRQRSSLKGLDELTLE